MKILTLENMDGRILLHALEGCDFGYLGSVSGLRNIRGGFFRLGSLSAVLMMILVAILPLLARPLQ